MFASVDWVKCLYSSDKDVDLLKNGFLFIGICGRKECISSEGST